MILQVLDVLLTLVHLAIIGFNLVGWAWQKTRRWHFIGILITLFSWTVLGIWYGPGYCPITDWQWQIKEKLGAENLPNSFIHYMASHLTGKDISGSLIDTLTVVFFAAAAGLSVYLNFIRDRFAARS